MRALFATVTLSALVGAGGTAIAIAPTSPASGSLQQPGSGTLEWTLDPLESSVGTLWTRRKGQVAGEAWRRSVPAPYKDSQQTWEDFTKLPAGRWFWRAVASVADVNAGDDDGEGCYDLADCDNSSTVDYLASEMRYFDVPAVLKNFHSERWWLRKNAQQYDIPVVFWTNADDALVEITARTAQRTYWRDSRGPGSTPYAKNRRKFTWDYSEASCSKPMWIVAKVTAGGKTITRRSNKFTFTCS